jgi:hypothetical protein
MPRGVASELLFFSTIHVKEKRPLADAELRKCVGNSNHGVPAMSNKIIDSIKHAIIEDDDPKPDPKLQGHPQASSANTSISESSQKPISIPPKLPPPFTNISTRSPPSLL